MRDDTLSIPGSERTWKSVLCSPGAGYCPSPPAGVHFGEAGSLWLELIIKEKPEKSQIMLSFSVFPDKIHSSIRYTIA